MRAPRVGAAANAPERLKKLQAADEQLSNDTLNDATDCFKNKKAEPHHTRVATNLNRIADLSLEEPSTSDVAICI